MPLSRDSLTNDSFKQAMLDEAPGAMSLMDPDAFEASRQTILHQASKIGELWVFAYGSLIWNPIIDVAEQKPAILTGWSRQFCVWAPIGRGTPEKPGFWLALGPGGSSTGLALRIETEKWNEETLILWRREMISGVYRPEMQPVEIDGVMRQCLVFLANPEHDRYAPDVSEDVKADAIACAEGSLGTCREYLFKLHENLVAHGMPDPYIETLANAVRARAGT